MLHFEFAFEFLIEMGFNQLVATCISPNTSICTCHVHASFCCVCLCIDCRHRFFSIGSALEGVPEYLSEEPYPFVVHRQATPLEHFHKSKSLAPAPYTALGQQRFKLLLSAAVVEPIPLHDLSLPQ